jgi:hypothetical protein
MSESEMKAREVLAKSMSKNTIPQKKMMAIIRDLTARICKLEDPKGETAAELAKKKAEARQKAIKTAKEKAEIAAKVRAEAARKVKEKKEKKLAAEKKFQDAKKADQKAILDAREKSKANKLKSNNK